MMADVDFKEEQEQSPVLKEVVVPETEVKAWLVNYVGNKINPKDGNVTVEMVVEEMAKEFPEFLMVLAEENFVRGYEQALTDVESLTKDTDV
tara:strand:- start:1226 stop:1501 length:276 start_codon:yes stop_codon:yes gene_type:complete